MGGRVESVVARILGGEFPMATIVPRRRGTEIYYYYHAAQRVKISPSDQGGKGRGSGPSKVVSQDIYLGTADTILRRLQDGPVEVHHRSFRHGDGCPLRD